MKTADTAFQHSITLNGKAVVTEIPTSLTLIDLLREQQRLRGHNISCARGVCGACTVIIDNRPAAACSTFAFEVDGTDVRTIEGLEDANGKLDPVQEAFADLSAFQCGYCTPGMIMLARSLLDCDPDPDAATITNWVSSNICRCTGYRLIVEAIQDAARRQRERTGDAG